MQRIVVAPPLLSSITVYPSGIRMGLRSMYHRLKRTLMCCVTPEPTDGYSTFVIMGMESLPANNRRSSSSYSSK